jgi:uncharacterized protein YqfA (UPF0365 family)
MSHLLPLLAATGSPLPWLLGVFAIVAFAAVVAVIMWNYWSVWFRAYMSSANISIWSLIGMSLRRVDNRVIVQAKIMVVQAAVNAKPA